MKPIKKPWTKTALNAPPDWNREEPCEVLWVARYGDVFQSHWKASWRERLHILLFGEVRLSVVASGHPPVAIDTEIKQ